MKMQRCALDAFAVDGSELEVTEYYDIVTAAKIAGVPTYDILQGIYNGEIRATITNDWTTYIAVWSLRSFLRWHRRS